MKSYKILLYQPELPLGNIPLNLLQSLLTLLKDGSEKNLRLLLERRSEGAGDRQWIETATNFIVEFDRFKPGESEISVKCSPLQEINAQPEELEEYEQLSSTLNLNLTSLDYFQQTLKGLMNRQLHSLVYDRSLIRLFKRFIATLNENQATVQFMFDSPLCLNPENGQIFSDIESAIPQSNHVRIGGYLQKIQPMTDSFLLCLTDKQTISVNLDPKSLISSKNLLNKPVILEGMAHYMANESLLRVDVDSIFSATETEMTQWSQLPKPLYSNFNFSELYVPQTPETGLGGIFGQWPGTETDEEIEAYLEELS